MHWFVEEHGEMIEVSGSMGSFAGLSFAIPGFAEGDFIFRYG